MRKKISRAILELQENGKIAELYDQWVNRAPVPKLACLDQGLPIAPISNFLGRSFGGIGGDADDEVQISGILKLKRIPPKQLRPVVG